MRRWSFQARLAAGALATIAVAGVSTMAIAWAQMSRLASEEARARVERAGERALDARARGLDPAIFERGSGVEIGVRSAAVIAAAVGDPRIPLWRAALDGGRASAMLPGELGAVAAFALPEGPVAGVLEARIARAVVAAPLRRFMARVGAVTLAVGLVAALAAGLLARRLVAPLDDLAAAAERIGRGDLARPVATAERALGSALGEALERMRQSLAEARSELDRRRSDLEAVVSGIAEGVVAVDRDRRVRYANSAAAALLGVDPESAVGRFCGDLLRPEPIGGRRPCDDACPILHARSRGPAHAVESLLAGGEPRSVALSASAPSDGLQVLILRDETALERARRARDAAVAELAHELQTPLAAQSASLELLRDRLVDSDRPAFELVQTLEAGTARLSRLIDNLLESVRIESGQLAIRRVAVDLEEVVEEAVAMTRALVDRRRQTLEVELPHPLPPTAGDPQRLIQVLVNLLANASKFGPEGSTIRLGVTLAERSVALWVEDEGPGFPPEIAARGWARFRRGGSEPRETGSGLGLWICRSILDRHGGGLAVERAGGRTRVVASLPRDQAA